MGVSIRDILKLPSMRKARVVAGKSELSRTISAISVLEFDDPKYTGKEMIGSEKFYGSEIMITSFMFAKDDLELQKRTLYRLHTQGEVGIIIYYVGRIMPRLDPELIAYAEYLQMPMIIMPESEMSLRYSDVIFEVLEAIIKDREQNTYFVTDVVEYISRLETSQRTIKAVLSALRERTHCSIFLFDEVDRMLNYEEWPLHRNLPIKDIQNRISAMQTQDDITEIAIDNQKYYVSWNILAVGNGELQLIIVKEKAFLSEHECEQIRDVLKTYINLWNVNYGKLDTRQLVSAIINDEPEKMRRIGDKLKINVKKLCYSYFLYDKHTENYDEGRMKTVRKVVSEFLNSCNRVVLTDVFDDTLIVFTERQKQSLDEDLLALLDHLREEGIDYSAIAIDTADTTKEVKDAYWIYQDYKDYIPIIFPLKKLITGGEMEFVKRAKDMFEEGVDYPFDFNEKLHQLFLTEKGEEDLKLTLETFLLDGDRNIVKTSELLFVHQNTVKYRLKHIESAIGHKITRMPEVYDYYMRSALNRLRRSLD